MRGRKKAAQRMTVMSIKIPPELKREVELAIIQRANKTGRIWSVGEFVRSAITETLKRVKWGRKGRKKSPLAKAGRGEAVGIRDGDRRKDGLRTSMPPAASDARSSDGCTGNQQPC